MLSAQVKATMKQLLLIPVLLSMSLAGCSSPQEQGCKRLETEIIALWQKGQDAQRQAAELQKEGDALLGSTDNVTKAIAKHGADGLTKEMKRITQGIQQRVEIMNSIPTQIQQIPDQWAAAGCSQERFASFQKSHPEIWPN